MTDTEIVIIMILAMIGAFFFGIPLLVETARWWRRNRDL